MSNPIAGTVVETYLRGRGITDLHGIDSLQFHPRCYYRPEADAPTEIWPAMIAAVTDLQGTSPARTAHGSIRPAATRRRSIPHAGRWAIFSGTRSVSVRLAT